MIGIKRAIASRYDTALSGREDISPMPRCEWATINGWLYSVLCGSFDDAESLIQHMQDNKIQARSFWESLSAQLPYAAYPKHLSGVSKSLSGRVVSLPCSSNLSADQQTRVLDGLAGWQGKQPVKAA
jgi:perosamine synthetase